MPQKVRDLLESHHLLANLRTSACIKNRREDSVQPGMVAFPPEHFSIVDSEAQDVSGNQLSHPIYDSATFTNQTVREYRRQLYNSNSLTNILHISATQETLTEVN